MAHYQGHSIGKTQKFKGKKRLLFNVSTCGLLLVGTKEVSNFGTQHFVSGQYAGVWHESKPLTTIFLCTI